ncbi:zinc finger domain-containing protein [Cellulomonas timonensis]|uniref:zinc finger domain-containing protein n=1 Tax=Cellulomonas timonensis TaxID=1689271 RepID=UPI000AEF65C8|nr:hypothetical protein [Cellulomonas timonensis]
MSQQVTVGVLVEPTDGVRALVGDAHVVLADPSDITALPQALPRATTHVLLLGEARHEAVLRRHAALLADTGPSVTWLALPHGPAALVVLALHAAAARLDAGLLPDAVEDLARRTWSGAWTPSVARLESPSPSLGQHARSMLPGGQGFVVSVAPAPGVLTVGDAPSPEDGAPAREALYSAAPGLPDVVLRTALGVSGASECVELHGLVLDAVGRFGHARAVELFALPADQRLAAPDGARLVRCAVCDAVIARHHCPYCRVRPVDVEATPVVVPEPLGAPL